MTQPYSPSSRPSRTPAHAHLNMKPVVLRYEQTELKMASFGPSPTMRRPAVAIKNMGVDAICSAGIFCLANSINGASEAPAACGLSLNAESPGLILSRSSDTRSNSFFGPPPPVFHVYVWMRVPDEPASKTMPYLLVSAASVSRVTIVRATTRRSAKGCISLHVLRVTGREPPACGAVAVNTRPPTGKKSPRGAGTHTGHTRDTRAHTGTRITQTPTGCVVGFRFEWMARGGWL